MLKFNKQKNNITKPYHHDNVRLPLRMVIYKTVSREELNQCPKRETNITQNRYRKYANVYNEIYAVKNIQNNNHYVQTNINFDSSELSSVCDIFNEPIKNKVNLKFENVISQNHTFKLDENKINAYSAVDLLKINKHESYNQSKFEINHVLFDLYEKISEDNEDFNTLKEKNSSITSALQHQTFFNTKHFMNGLNLLGIFDKTDL